MQKTSLDIAPFWPDIRYFEELDSSNLELRRLVEQGEARHGTVILTDYQSLGRGQLNSRWQAEKGKHLMMSLLLEPNVPVEKQYLINKATALALCAALADQKVQARIKWPNDILVKGKKVAGILIENSLTGNQLNRCIIGIGINIRHQEFEGLPHAACLEDLTDQEISNNQLMEAFFMKLNEVFTFPERQIDLQYGQLLWLRHERTTFVSNNEEVEGKVIEVDAGGRLILENDGKRTAFAHKEITWTGW